MEIKIADEAGNKEAGASWATCQILDEDSFCFLPSSHDQQVLIVNDHPLQQHAIQQAGFSYWKCQQKGCNFRAMYNFQHNHYVKTTDVHNHAPQPGSLRKWKLITAVRRRVMESPQSSPKDLYDTEVDRIRKQVREENCDSWKIPSYSLVKYYLYHEKTVAKEAFAEEEEMNLPSTIEEVARREVTEAEREFLEKPSEYQDQSSGMNLSLLTPNLIKSKHFPDLCFYFVPSRKGKRILVVNDFTFHLNTQKPGGRFYWKCTVEPCMYRCVYNQEMNDIVKVNGKHTHMTNIHQLRIREFVHLLKSRLLEDPSLSPKSVYDQELEKLKNMDNGTALAACMPAFASIRTSLYNIKNKKSYEAAGADLMTNDLAADMENEKGQDISPKAITHLSLEDNENMDYENDDKDTSSTQPLLLPSLEIATPSLYDSHDIIDQLNDGDGKESTSTIQEPLCQCHEELEPDLPDPSSYTFTFVPTNRGGQALAVNDCILRSSFVRDSVSYWRCQQKECSFKCSFDSKANKLLKVSGRHNHSINPWNVHIRSFVRVLKKRMSQNSHLSSKVIYEQEVSQLRKDGKKDDLLSKLPSYESLKSALYKVKRPHSVPDCHEWSDDFTTEKVTDDANYDGSEPERQERPQNSCTDPPEDSVIETFYAPLNIHIESWLGQDPENKVVDGHLLVRQSNTDATASTCWICSRKGCLFRCVIDNESKTILKGKWYHTHRSEVRHIICKTVFNAVKRRALAAAGMNPKIIYYQEKKRMEEKIAKNPALLKFIPTYPQVYQLILKTRCKQSPSSKQVNMSKSLTATAKLSVIKDVNEIPNTASSSHLPMKEVENMTDTYNYESSKVTSSRTLHSSFRHEQKNISNNQNRNNSSIIESVACVEEMEPTFGYDHHSLHQLAELDYPVGESGINHEPYGNQQPSVHEHLVLNHLSGDQELILNEVSVNNQSSRTQVCAGSQANFKHDYLASCHYLPHTIDYHNTNSSGQLNVSSQFAHMTQDTRISSSETLLSQQISSNQILPPHNQSALLVNSGSALSRENTSCLPASFSATSSLAASSSTSPIFFPSSSQLATTTINPLNIPQQSPMDQSVFTLHGYHVFPASAQAGHIYWQCHVPDCHFQCVYNVVTGQVVQISESHNHEAPTSQQVFSLQSKNFIEDSSHSQPVQVHGTETFKDFVLDSEHNRLFLHDEEMLFMWRKHEILHWKCKRSDCRFKCVYDEELQSLHVLSTHSPHCPSQSREIYQGPALKRRLYPNETFTRPAKCPRLDQ